MGSGNSKDLIREMREFIGDIKEPENPVEDEEEEEDEKEKSKEDNEEDEETKAKEDMINRGQDLIDKYKIRNIGDPPRNKGKKIQQDSIQERIDKKHQRFQEDMRIGKSGLKTDKITDDFIADFEKDYKRDDAWNEFNEMYQGAEMYFKEKCSNKEDFAPGIAVANELDKRYIIKGTVGKKSSTEDFGFGGIDRAGVFENTEQMRGKIEEPIIKAEILNDKSMKREMDDIIDTLYAIQVALQKSERPISAVSDGYRHLRSQLLTQFKYLKGRYTGKYSNPHMKAVLQNEAITFDGLSLREKIDMDADLVRKGEQLEKLGKLLKDYDALMVKQMESELTRDFGEGDFVDCKDHGETSGLGWLLKEKARTLYRVDV